MIRVIKKIWKILSISIASIFVISLLLGFLVSLPPVQNRAVWFAKNWLATQLKTEITLEGVDFAIPNHAILEGITIYDRQDEVLLQAEELSISVVNFSLWSFLFDKEQTQILRINQIHLEAPRIQLYTQSKDGILNLSALLAKEEEEEYEEEVPKKSRLQVELPSITINNGYISLVDSTVEEGSIVYDKRINFKNMHFDPLFVDLGCVIEPDGGIKMAIRNISLAEKKSAFVLDHLSAILRMDTSRTQNEIGLITKTPFIRLDSLKIKAQRSQVTANVLFPNQGLANLFKDKTRDQFRVDLAPTLFDFASLNYFIKKPVPLVGVVNGKGFVHGNAHELWSENFQASYLNNSIKITTDLHLENLEDEDSLWLDIQLFDSRTSMQGLRTLLPNVKFPKILDEIETAGVNGSFVGHHYDFNIDADLQTDAGNVITSLHLILPPYVPLLTYKGLVATQKLKLNQLEIEKFIKSDDITFVGSVEGKGVNINEVNTRFEGKITDSDLYGYRMDSVYANVNIENRNIKGRLKIADTEGSADVEVDLDLNEANPSYDVKGSVRKLNLQRYNLYKQPILFSSDLNADIQGNDPDYMSGFIELEDAKLYSLLDSTELRVDSFLLRSEDNQLNQKNISLKSSILDADLSGDFTVNKAISLTKRLIREARLFFQNQDSTIQEYYANKLMDSVEVNVDFELETHSELNEAFTFLKQSLFLSPQSKVIGNLTFAETDHAELDVSIDSLAYKNTAFHAGAMYVDLTKYTDQNSILMVGDAQTRRLYLSPTFMVENASVDVQWFENEIECSVFAEQKEADEQKNFLRMRIDSEFFRDGHIVSKVDSNSTQLKIGNYDWRFGEGDSVVYMKRKFWVDDFRVETDGQLVKAEGAIGLDDSDADSLVVLVNGFQMNTLNELTKMRYTLEGELNASTEIRNLLHTPKIGLDAFVETFQFDQITYGDILINSDWEQETQAIGLGAKLVYDQDTLLELGGAYHLDSEEEVLDFELNTPTAIPLNFISPFVKTQLYDIQGGVRLKSFTIKGSPKSPVVKGQGYFDGASFGVDFFKTKYRFDGAVLFDVNSISFPRIQIFDKNDHYAEFYGSIYHKGLKEFRFDLQIDKIKNFLIMDTKKQDNDLFFGSIYIKDGIASVTGDIETISIVATGITGPNSSLKIPLSDNQNLQRPDYIRFVGDQVQDEEIKKKVVGFDLNLTVVATNDAEVDIIFDERVGDIIRGRGEGNLNIQVNERVGFAMFGDYEITQGNYLFTAQNIVNKKFFVRPGGRITWNGDPYDARLKLDALYPVPGADIREIIGAEDPVRVPVNVLMELDGSLMQPAIDLNIEIPNINEQDALAIVPYLKTISNDQQELNKQVFSLLIFNRFAPYNSFLGEGAVNTGVTTSISELLSNQLNYWLSRAVNDKINVAVGSNNLQDVTLLVSAKFFDDRLTIERDGTLVGSNTDVSIGNISVSYKLLPPPGEKGKTRRPGELVLEGFTRQNLSAQLNNTQQAGIGLFYKKDFDSIWEIFKRKKK